ncbi:MAG: hypothetical protein HRT44_01610 [Bdellovibrionales bacterium]|nr:hypothetical protein [Bdellovibrionales bacterium]NQZ17942.1 hypothetical protein [Bdellovibrionales bacterium]
MFARLNEFLIFVMLVFTLLSGLSCSLISKTEKPKKYTINYPRELDEVNTLIDERKTADARMRIDDYVNKAENIHWYGHAYFLKAFIFEMDENYPEAIKYYRSSIDHSADYNSQVEAKALYNISFVYERVRNMEKLLTSLLDIMKRREYLDVLTGQVETPARLAAVYAYMGKTKEAYIFHREAARNFKQIVRNARFRSPKSEISKSLYYLGLAVYDKDSESFESLSKKVGPGQKYLLGSAEASKSLWSQKAANQLTKNYNKLWSMVTDYEAKGFDKDPRAKRKRTHMRQLEMASDIYDYMHRLKAEEFPMSQVNPRSKRVIDQSNKWIRIIEDFANKLDLGPDFIRWEYEIAP